MNRSTNWGPTLHCVCMVSFFSPVQLCDPMDCSLPGSSVHGILQARMLEWVVKTNYFVLKWIRLLTFNNLAFFWGKEVSHTGYILHDSLRVVTSKRQSCSGDKRSTVAGSWRLGRVGPPNYITRESFKVMEQLHLGYGDAWTNLYMC